MVLGSYVHWVRNNPGSAKSLEQAARTAVLMMSDARNLIQFETGIAVTNVIGIANQEILSPMASAGWASDAARITHSVLCEFQCIVELIARQRLWRDQPARSNRLVVAIEAIKSLLIIVAKWRAVRLQFRRAIDTLAGKQPRGALVTAESAESFRPSRLRVPEVSLSYVDPATGAVTAPTFTSWREWLRFIVDILYLVRPVWYAAIALRTRRSIVPPARHAGGFNAVANIAAVANRRAAWRAWLLSLAVESMLVLATYAADYGSTPVVTDREVEELTEEADQDVAKPTVASERTRALGMYVVRSPFFDRFLRDRIERWVVRGWFARNVPLLGAMVAFQTQAALKLQHESFLYTAGGAKSPAMTTTFRTE